MILDLIKNGEYDSAKQFLKRHIDWYVKFIEQTLRENEGKRKREHVGM